VLLFIKVVSKLHLMSDSGVVPQIEILTYWRVRSVFNSGGTLVEHIKLIKVDAKSRW
jgi:hypothetical protein